MSKQYSQTSEKNILQELKEELLKSNLQIFILSTVKSLGEISGYDVLLQFRKRYDVNISVGTIYSQLYSLERKKLIEGQLAPSGARKYTLTSNGVKTIDIIMTLKPQIVNLFDSIFTI